MQSKEELLESLLEINPNCNPDLIEKAYDVGVRMHDGQLRKSGEPYFVHPLAVAKILAELGMDERTIVAGLLHDVVEDTESVVESVDFSDPNTVKRINQWACDHTNGLEVEIGRASCRERV